MTTLSAITSSSLNQLPLSNGGVLTFAKYGGLPSASAVTNASALNDFGTFAKAESAAGRGVHLFVPPGTYNINLDNCGSALYNVKRLVMEGYGAKFQSTATTFPSPWISSCQSRLFVGFLINSTAVANTSVTLVTAGDNTNFAVGDWIMVGSLDLQYGGYPPNCDRFEFTQITAIASGVISVSPAIQNVHLSTFPDGNASSPCGAARIYQLNKDFSFNPASWDLFHEFRGIEFVAPAAASSRYWSLIGRHIRLKDVRVNGISPTVIQNFEMIGGETWDAGQNEPDKLISYCLLDGVNCSNSMIFQSSSCDRLIVRGGDYSVLSTGTSKYSLVEGANIQFFTDGVPGQPYGTYRDTTLMNCYIHDTSQYQFTLASLLSNLTIDGTTYAYSNGTFAVLKTAIGAGEWGVIPGMTVNLQYSTGVPSSDLGTGIITALREDATKVYIDTTLPFAAMPAWSSGKVSLVRGNKLSVINCSGADQIRRASKATAAGCNPHEYYAETFAGASATSGYWLEMTGILREAYFNVVQISPDVAARMVFNLAVVQASSMTGTPVSLTITIDTHVAGIRDFTQTALTGKTTNDTVLLNGAAQIVLPADEWCLNNLAWSITGTTPARQTAIVDVFLRFDSGILRKLVTTYKDDGGNVVAAVTGALP